MKRTTRPQLSAKEGTLLTDSILMEATNLRRDPLNPTIWRLAGKPRKVFSLGVLPFLRFSPFGDQREIELSTDGDNNLYGRIITGRAEEDYPTSPTPLRLAQLAGKPILAVTGAPGIIRLLLSHAADCFLTYDEDLKLTFEGEMPGLPEIELLARDATDFYEATGDIALKGNSSGMSGSQLSADDAERVKNAVASTYRQLREKARNFGCWVQPITARYRLLDAAGNTVAVGPHTQLNTSGRVPTGKVVFTSTDGMQSLSSGSMQMQSYMPAVVVPKKLPYPWNRIIDTLIIEVTEELEPLDMTIPLSHGVVKNAQTGVVAVTAQLPGLDMSEAVTQAIYDKLIYEQNFAQFYRAFTFGEPFGGSLTYGGNQFMAGDEVKLGVVAPSNFEEAPAGEGERRRVTYSAALDAGEFTILCNPKDEDGNYSPGVAEVTRSEDLGEILSRRRVMEREIGQLAPLPRSGSGWDFSRLKLLMFGADGICLATLNGKGEFHSITTVDHRRIATVCEATGTNGATLLALAGEDVVEISGQKVSTIWSRAAAPSAMGNLTGIGWCEKQREIWLTNGIDLWRLTAAGELIVAALPGIAGIDYQPPLRLGRSRGALLLATSREVRNLSDEESDGLLDVHLRMRGRSTELLRGGLSTGGLSRGGLSQAGGLLSDGSSQGFNWLELRVFGSGLLGNFRLLGDRGTEIAEELLKVVISGDVNAPIPLRVALPYRQWLEEEYTFAANADLAIHNSQLLLAR